MEAASMVNNLKLTFENGRSLWVERRGEDIVIGLLDTDDKMLVALAPFNRLTIVGNFEITYEASLAVLHHLYRTEDDKQHLMHVMLATTQAICLVAGLPPTAAVTPQP